MDNNTSTSGTYNPNQELLDYAVENVKEWPENCTTLHDLGDYSKNIKEADNLDDK